MVCSLSIAVIVQQPLAEGNSRFLVVLSLGKVDMEHLFVPDIVNASLLIEGEESTVAGVLDTFDSKVQASGLPPCRQGL